MLIAVPAIAAMVALTSQDTFAVVDVDAADSLMGLGGQVTRQLLEGATALSLNTLTPDQLRAQLTAEKYQALRKCHESTACVAQALGSAPITRVITGQLTRDERSYLLKLWHHDLKAMTVVADVDRAVLIAARRFQKDVEQAVPPLLRGEKEARGTLTITCNVATAQISVNGEFLGTSPVTLARRPGKYEVKVEKNKYLPVTRLVAIEANQESSENIKLLLIPGQVPDEPLASPGGAKSVSQQGSAAAGATLSAPTWLFGALTVAAGASASIFGVLARTQSSTLLASFDEAMQVSTSTRAQALEQNRNAVIANVSFVALGAFAVATVVFLIIDLAVPKDPVVSGSKGAP
jgi:hypothetical protein